MAVILTFVTFDLSSFAAGVLHLLWRLWVLQPVPQLELVGLAAVQRGEARQQVDELAAGRRRRAGGLPSVPSPHGRRAGRRHGVHHQGGPRSRVAVVSLAGRRGQGAVAEVQGGEEGRGVDRQPVGVQRGGRGPRAVACVLLVLGLDDGALGQLVPDPLAGLRLAHRGVLLARLGGGPLDGPVLQLGLAPWWREGELHTRTDSSGSEQLCPSGRIPGYV